MTAPFAVPSPRNVIVSEVDAPECMPVMVVIAVCSRLSHQPRRHRCPYGCRRLRSWCPRNRTNSDRGATNSTIDDCNCIPIIVRHQFAGDDGGMSLEPPGLPEAPAL